MDAKEAQQYELREIIEHCIAEISEYPDDMCLDDIADLRIMSDGRLELLNTHPESYESSIPESVWHGRVLRLDFGIGAMPKAVAELLSEHIDLLETICSGFNLLYDRGTHKGKLTDTAKEAYEALIDGLNAGEDFWLGKRIVRYAPEDFFGHPYPPEFYALTTPEAVRQWVSDEINDGKPFDSQDGESIIIDLDQAIDDALSQWQAEKEREAARTQVEVSWEE